MGNAARKARKAAGEPIARQQKVGTPLPERQYTSRKTSMAAFKVAKMLDAIRESEQS